MPESEPIEGEFDYIIVGAGSAGCLLANRLSADPSKRVLLLEAGGKDNWIWFHIPVGYLFAIGNPRSDWMFKTEPEPGLNGRSLNYPRGKVIGGSSAINAMVYMRGQAGDYDHWRQLGLPGWSWSDVLPYFRKHEHHFLGESEHHAIGGEWHVEYPRLRWDIIDVWREAAAQYGIKPSNDFNTGDNEGTCYFHVNQRRGRRWSAARGFLKPVLNRQNLRLETHCLVEGLIIDNKRAVGVRFKQDGAAREARCRGEVIMAAGSIGSPQIMMLSGIGPAADLSALGIPVVLDKPGLGANLHDHLQLRMIYKVSGIRTLNEMYGSLLGARLDGRELCAVPARAADDGAVAARRLHPLRSVAGPAEFAVSHPAALARQVRRSAARLPGFHRERREFAADQPRLAQAEITRPGGGAVDPAELSRHAGGPARRRGFDPRHPRDLCAAGARALSAGGVSAGAAGA